MVYIAYRPIGDHDAAAPNDVLLDGVEEYQPVDKTFTRDELKRYPYRVLKTNQVQEREAGSDSPDDEPSTKPRSKRHHVVTVELRVTMEGAHIELELRPADRKFDESSRGISPSQIIDGFGPTY